MLLIDKLHLQLESETSPFRAQLIREDLARLTKLQSLALQHENLEEFIQAGLYIGWTRDDMRTHELKDELNSLLEAVFCRQRQTPSESHEDDVIKAWIALSNKRMETVIHCL